ncbi:unnamed protein product [Rotaria sp. Silwood1]|nr:unnamed protein product [Rotaria sp. Silwood1]CAF1399797.1 unnamed protein product [Rotaria sp. Silwood1]CAF3545066.1 unnamed protein product [Rotaria sp. Silwood1]CAF3630446.1 unnamed protein product [Rotaria sp. Silwood1]CAF3665280.1 unnamed protein product [Rotaria sp. Silwood1]
MSKELFNYLLDSNDNVRLEPESISLQHDLPRIPAPICSHLCIRHRLLRLNYYIASPHQSYIALCKKHLHRHLQVNEEEKFFYISNKNSEMISNINHLIKKMTHNNNHC